MERTGGTQGKWICVDRRRGKNGYVKWEALISVFVNMPRNTGVGCLWSSFSFRRFLMQLSQARREVGACALGFVRFGDEAAVWRVVGAMEVVLEGGC